MKKRSKLAVLSRLMLIAGFLLTVIPDAGVALAAPSTPPLATQAAPVAANNPSAVTLKLASARTEANWPGKTGGIQVGQDPVALLLPDKLNYKWIINLDNAGTPTQARNAGCSPANPNYPDSCDWPSIHSVSGSSPIITQGNQDELNATQSLNLSPGKYLISVVADNFKIDGEHFTVDGNGNPLQVKVQLQPYPLPLGTIRIQVFNDNAQTNGQFDVPGEVGLAGFEGHIYDVLEIVTTDWFGNPICTDYQTTNPANHNQHAGQFNPTTGLPTGWPVDFDSNGKPVIRTVGGKCLSRADGQIIIPNIGPNRYTAQVVPPNGQTWVQTTTLEGWHDFDVWTQEGASGFDTEFTGPNNEPQPAIPFGFVRPTSLPTRPIRNGEIKGVVAGSKTYIPQVGGVPLNNQDFNIGAGTKIDKPINKPWIALSDLRQGDATVYTGQGNADGSFDIKNVPDSDYSVALWDTDQSYILELRNVTVSGGQVVDMGTVLLAGWWTTFTGRVCVDSNQNGKCEATERGVANQPVTLKTRVNSVMDRGTNTVLTDLNGNYTFPNGYPLTAWVVMEVYNDSYQTVGVTYQADNQPTETTVLGAGVDVNVHPVIGLSGRLDWALKRYDITSSDPNVNNGGIVGTVTYDSTRNETNARFAATEAYQPGIPDIKVDLYSPVKDANGNFVLNADGSYQLGAKLDEYTTETWKRPQNCVARDVNGNPVVQQVLPAGSGKDCLEVPLMGVQYGFESIDTTPGAPNFATTVNGNYGFGGLEPGDYLVKVVIPNDQFGKPLYKVTKEEDVNVFNGDQFTPQVPPPPCAGALHTVDVKGVGTDGPGAVANAGWAAVGGSPYEGQPMPLCDVKLISVQKGKSIAPNFNLFTDVPIPGRFAGLIVDDLNVSTNPQDSLYGEKRGVPNSPIGVYDFNDRLVTTIQSDPNGLFEVLMPSTSTYNCPLPAGPCPNVYRFVGNDPGAPGRLNANYNPQYRTISASFEMWPGLMIPADLAPTTIGTSVGIPGSQFNALVSCKLSATTPQVLAVSQPYVRLTNPVNNPTITVSGQGFGATQGTGVLTLTGNDNSSQVVTPGIVSWNDGEIKFNAASNTPDGSYQLDIKNSSGKTTANGLNFHILRSGNGTYNPTVYEVGPGKTYSQIQTAIEAASNQPRALVVVYPGTPATYNPHGVYYENLIIHSPLKLQGVGPGGVRADNSYVQGTVLDGLGFQTSGVDAFGQPTEPNADAWYALLGALTWSGNQTVPDGAVITVLARTNNQFTNAYRGTIDGFIIQGGDQLGQPNENPGNTTPGTTPPVTQGGGIFVNGYAHYLRITNNILQSNGGSYGGAIRIGNPYSDNANNNNIVIAENRVLANGGSNLAGGIGLFRGSDNYEVANNDICANYSSEYGGGISHFGFSPGGKIHDNRIYFNYSYDEGAGIMVAGELQANPATLSPGSGAVDIYNNTIEANLANDDGGGLRFLMAGNYALNVYNNMIVNNVSTHEGGGVGIDDAPQINFYNNTVMKNLTTATAATSNGQPAPAGLSTTYNSTPLQNSLPASAPTFSSPVLFNNIFWDNRAGTWDSVNGKLFGLGLDGDPTAINYWDMGVTGGPDKLSPTNSILQIADAAHITASPTNKVGTDPLVASPYNVSVMILPWRGDPHFVGVQLVAVETPIDQAGNYHLQNTSPAVNSGAANKAVTVAQGTVARTVNAPAFDIDRDGRPSAGPAPSTTVGYEVGADELPGAATPPPALTILDNFNRANTLGTLGANWFGQGFIRVNNNQAQVLSSGYNFWNGSNGVFGANQEAFFTFAHVGANASEQDLLLKAAGLSNAGAITNQSHLIEVAYNNPNHRVTVSTLSPNGVWVDRAVFNNVTFAAGDLFRAQARNDGTVNVYKNATLIGTTNVTTGPNPWPAAYVTGGGRIGVWFISPNFNNANDIRFDDFGGGTIN